MKFKSLILTGLCAASLSTAVQAKDEFWENAKWVSSIASACIVGYAIYKFPIQIEGGIALMPTTINLSALQMQSLPNTILLWKEAITVPYHLAAAMVSAIGVYSWLSSDK